MKNITFCEYCREDVGYIVEDKTITSELKSNVYTYVGKVAKCEKCHSEVFVPEIIDYNLKALYDVYRKKNGIISLDKILEIPKKYSIGKRPLSLLLGWGELTFSRYCDGDMPSKQYSDILNKIYNDPKYYEEILEANKGNIKSETAYKKSRMALDKYINKDDELTKYLLDRCEDITPLSIRIALFYIDGFYYAFYNETIFNKALSTKEKVIIDNVCDNLCCYSGKILKRFLLIDEIKSKEQFIEIKAKYNMTGPDDIKAYAIDMFNKIKGV